MNLEVAAIYLPDADEVQVDFSSTLDDLTTVTIADTLTVELQAASTNLAGTQTFSQIAVIAANPTYIQPQNHYALKFRHPRRRKDLFVNITAGYGVNTYTKQVPVGEGISPQTSMDLPDNVLSTYDPFKQQSGGPFLPPNKNQVVLNPRVLQLMMNRKIYVTEKIDGTSFTCFLYKDEFGVCSRNMELKESEGNLYWKIARGLDLENKLRHFRQSTMGHEIAIQGEVYGQGIQGNKYHLEDVRLAVFNVYDISEGKYLNFTQFKACCDALELTTVPILNEWSEIKNDDVESWIQKAFGESVLYPQTPREGIVVRGLDEETIDRYGRFSFKVINNEFLLRYGE